MIRSIRHQRTVAVIRLLAQLGGVRRPGGRVPRMVLPDLIGMEYFKAIHEDAAGIAEREAARVRSEVLRLCAEAAETSIFDAMDGPFPGRGGARRFELKRRADDLVDRAATAAVEAFRPKEKTIKAVAEKMAERTNEFNRRQIDKQTRVALGVPLASIEGPTRIDVEYFAHNNVQLISSVPKRYFDRIRDDVADAFEKGTQAETLAKRWAKRYDMAVADTLLIARDQIGKLNAQINAERQQAMGVQTFTWITMRDNAVCDYCDQFDGQSFRYDDPPECMPGECHPQDRCSAQADYGSLVDSLAE